MAKKVPLYRLYLDSTRNALEKRTLHMGVKLVRFSSWKWKRLPIQASLHDQICGKTIRESKEASLGQIFLTRFVLLTSIPFHTSLSGPVCVLRTNNQGRLHSFPLGELGKRQIKGCFKDEIQVVQERVTILRGDGGVWRCFKRVQEWESRSPFVLNLVIYEQLAFSSDLHLLAHLPSILGQMEQRRRILVGRRPPWPGGRLTWAPSCCEALKFEGLMISWKKNHILQTHQGRPRWESSDCVFGVCVYSTRTYNIEYRSVLYKAWQKIYTSLAKCSLSRFSLPCEQSNCFRSIYHSQFAYTILWSVGVSGGGARSLFFFFCFAESLERGGKNKRPWDRLVSHCLFLSVSAVWWNDA